MITIWHWHTEPFLLGGLLGAAWLYFSLIGPLRAWLAPGRAYPRGRAVSFGAGLFLFYLAIGSPLDPLGEGFLFSAHMVQHILFMYLAAPLLIAGLPPWLTDRVLNGRPALCRTVRILTHPLVGGAIFTGVFSGWHFPALYETALASKPVHIAQHLSMLAASLLIWWAFLSPCRLAPRLSHGARILYIFVLTVVQIPVFVYLVFADEAHYATYRYAPRLLDLTPLEDQVLGGILMKTSTMVLALVLMALVFSQWHAENADRSNSG